MVCHTHHSGAKDTPTFLPSKTKSALAGRKTRHRLLKKFCVTAAEPRVTFLTKEDETATTGANLKIKMLQHTSRAQLTAVSSRLDILSFKYSSQVQLEEIIQALLNSFLQNL